MKQEENRIQSIKQRLKNLSEEKGIGYDYILLVYMNEGLLRRLEASRFSRNFILKGGFLLSSMLPSLGRTTRDLDFLGKEIANDVAGIKLVFSEICSMPCDDSLAFPTDKIVVDEIKEDNFYPGIRVTVPCLLGRSKHMLQLDVGYGDRVTPGEKEYSLHVFLHEPISLYVYPLETIVAEKFEAMITLDSINSRMKDFFDLYSIFRNLDIDRDILSQAIQNTFKVRNTVCPEEPAVFSEVFYADPVKERMWVQFLKRINSNDDFPFHGILPTMYAYLEPIYTRIKSR